MIKEDFDPRLKWPFTSEIVGSSFSGKTTLLCNIMNNIEDVLDTIPDRILYVYRVSQPFFQDFPNVNFIKDPDNEILEIDNLKALNGLTWIIFDDCLPESEYLRLMYTVYSHHLNLSITICLQNLFSKQVSALREVSLNCHYLLLTRSPRSVDSIRIFARQCFGENFRAFMEIWDEIVMSNIFTYLLVDTHPRSPFHHKIRTKIIPKVDGPMELFVPNKKK